MEFHLILDERDLRFVDSVLVTLPYGQVAALIAKINEQIKAQQKNEGERRNA